MKSEEGEHLRQALTRTEFDTRDSDVDLFERELAQRLTDIEFTLADLEVRLAAVERVVGFGLGE
jgi:hypothetical protein